VGKGCAVTNVVQDVGEQPLALHSELQEPLEKMGFLARALVQPVWFCGRGAREVDEDDIVMRRTESEPTS
jgi:hypothetical protein